MAKYYKKIADGPIQLPTLKTYKNLYVENKTETKELYVNEKADVKDIEVERELKLTKFSEMANFTDKRVVINKSKEEGFLISTLDNLSSSQLPKSVYGFKQVFLDFGEDPYKYNAVSLVNDSFEVVGTYEKFNIEFGDIITNDSAIATILNTSSFFEGGSECRQIVSYTTEIDSTGFAKLTYYSYYQWNKENGVWVKEPELQEEPTGYYTTGMFGFQLLTLKINGIYGDEETKATISGDISFNNVEVVNIHTSSGELNENLIFPATQYTADMEVEAFSGTFYEKTSFMNTEDAPAGTKLIYLENDTLKFCNTYPPYSGLKYGKPESVNSNKTWFDGIHWLAVEDGTTYEDIQCTFELKYNDRVFSDLTSISPLDDSIFFVGSYTEGGYEWWSSVFGGIDTGSGYCKINLPNGLKASDVVSIDGKSITWVKSTDYYYAKESFYFINTDTTKVSFTPRTDLNKTYLYISVNADSRKDVSKPTIYSPTYTVKREVVEIPLSDFTYTTPTINISNDREVSTQAVQAFVDYRQNAINELLDLRSAETAAAVQNILDILQRNNIS